MALILEDGSGNPKANSYTSLAEAEAYFAEVPNAKWAGENAKKEEALIVGTRYIELMYGLGWKGIKRSQPQRLKWPRVGVYVDSDPDGTPWLAGFGNVRGGYVLPDTCIPEPLKQAVCEAAVRYLAGDDLIPDLKPGDGQVLNETTGPLSTTYTSGKIPYKRYRVIEMLIADLLRGSSETVELIRG